MLPRQTKQTRIIPQSLPQPHENVDVDVDVLVLVNLVEHEHEHVHVDVLDSVGHPHAAAAEGRLVRDHAVPARGDLGPREFEHALRVHG